MGRVSELYQIQYTYGDYDKLAYSWGDGNHPSTYQSFATTGKGLIDQSIFMFNRPNDAWSLGAYCTTITAGADVDHPRLTVTKNRLSKNNVLVANDRWTGQGSLAYSSYAYIRNFEYSPQPTMTGLWPWIDFAYNRFCLLPSFGFMNPSTGQTTSMLTYNEAVAGGYTNWYITHLRIECYNEPSAGTIINPLCIQFAGRMNDVELTPSGYGGYCLTLSNDVAEGVFYIPLNTGVVLDMYAVNTYNEHVNPGGCTNTVFWDLTQMDTRVVERASDHVKVLTISFDDVLKMVNRLGFYWAKEQSAVTSAKGVQCQDPNLVCPLIDPDTHTVTDTVLSGSDIAQYCLDHYQDKKINYLLDYGDIDGEGNPIGLDTDEYRENYDPEPSSVEPADEIDIYPPVAATTGGTALWMMTQDDVETLFTTLWDPDGTKVDDIAKGIFLFGENPMDSIISLRFYPLNLQNLVTYNQHHIMFGRWDTRLSNYYITSSNIICLNLGQFSFNDVLVSHDFRDYEPYTEYQLYIPFCGVVDVAAYECVDTILSIKMIIDLTTGACTAVVFTNSVPYKYIDGMIGIEVPVTGRDMSSYANTVMGAALAGAGFGSRPGKSAYQGQQERKNLALEGQQIAYENKMWDVGEGFGAVATKAGGMSVALGASFIAGGALLFGTAAALTNAPKAQMAGSNTPACGLAKPLYPYFIVTRSDTWIPENYNELYGRPLNKGGVVGDFTGFSKFADIKAENISNATPEEVKLIIDLLQSGVYI